MTPKKLKEQVRAVQKGLPGAMELLLAHFAQQIKALAAREMDYDTRDELVSAGRIALWETAMGLDLKRVESPEAYLFVAIRNGMVQVRREGMRERALIDAVRDALPRRERLATDSAEGEYFRRERENHLRELLAAAPAKLAPVLKARLEGKEQLEVAETIGASERTVRRREKEVVVYLKDRIVKGEV